MTSHNNKAQIDAEVQAINNHTRKARPDESWASGYSLRSTSVSTTDCHRPTAAPPKVTPARCHAKPTPGIPGVKPPTPPTPEEAAAKSLKAERQALWDVVSRWVGNPAHPDHRNNLKNAMRVFELQHHMRNDHATAQPHQPTTNALTS